MAIRLEVGGKSFFQGDLKELTGGISLIALGVLGVAGSTGYVVFAILGNHGVDSVSLGMRGLVISIMAIVAGAGLIIKNERAAPTVNRDQNVIPPPINREEFEDALTGEPMVHPILLPPREAGNRIDRSTLRNPRYCPTKVENGVRYFQNPFTTVYYPEEDFIPDIELERRISLAG